MEESKTEQRQYTEAVVQALIEAAAGDTLTADATAAAEVASGFWGRAFAVATCTPPVVPAWILSSIGRELVRAGESLWLVEVDAGELSLLPVAAHQVEGGSSPSQWSYRVQVNSPSNSQRSESVSGTQVVHCMYSRRREQPWIGISPLTWAADTAQAMGRSESRMKEEAGTPTGYVLPTPQQTGGTIDEQGALFDPLAPLRQRISRLAGKMLLVESMQSGWSEGRAAAPQAEWSPRRLGANPPEGLLVMRRLMQDALLAACGVPPGLASADQAASQASREAWRQFLHGTIQPVATLVEAELRDKLNRPELTLTFDRLFASDLQGRARAFQSMVGGGMEVGRAAALSGLMEVD